MLLISILLYFLNLQTITCLGQYYVAQNQAQRYYITQAVAEAYEMASAAAEALNDPNVIFSEAFGEWFGLPNAALRETIRDRNYRRFTALDPLVETVDPYPGVAADSIVWIRDATQYEDCINDLTLTALTNPVPFLANLGVPFSHGSILCDVFFELPIVAFTQAGESAARVILHEAQHMTLLMGLNPTTGIVDILDPATTQNPQSPPEGCYSAYCCANLPFSDRIKNAENYARFAQDARRDPERVKGSQCLRIGTGEEALRILAPSTSWGSISPRERLLSSDLLTFPSLFTKALSRTTNTTISTLSFEKSSTRSSTTTTISISSSSKFLTTKAISSSLSLIHLSSNISSTKAISSSLFSISSFTTASSNTVSSTTTSSISSSTIALFIPSSTISTTLISLSSSVSSLSSTPAATETIITRGPITVKPGCKKTTIGEGRTHTASKCETVIGGLGGCFFVLSDGKDPVHLKHGATATAGDPHNTIYEDPDPDPTAMSSAPSSRSTTGSTSSSSSSSRRSCRATSTVTTRTFTSERESRGLCMVTGTAVAEMVQLLLANPASNSSTSTSTSTTTSSSTGSRVPSVTRSPGDPNPRPTDTVPISTPELISWREVSTTSGFTDSIDCFFSQGDGTSKNYHVNITLSRDPNRGLEYQYAIGCNCFDGSYTVTLELEGGGYEPIITIPGVDGDRVVQYDPYNGFPVNNWKVSADKE